MKVLALETPGPSQNAETPPALLREEAAHVWRLQQAGVIREIYFRGDRTDAVLILECSDAAEAGAILATLPLVAAGRIAFEVIPLRPYPGLARLFADHEEMDG